ncbi:1750_t:CDS:10 [Entrophospora sp. SA101]|nr:1750_t:CDS:10 [Entrophospora sp. SA101]
MGNSQSLNLQPPGSGKDDKSKDDKDKDKKKKWEPPLPTRMERIKDYLLMEEEFVQNQERLKPQEEKAQEERTRVDDLRGSPMGVGTLEEIIDDDHAIVSSSTGPEYYVSILSFVDKDLLEPGCSILLHHKAMSVVGVLQDDTDPMVSVMKLEKAPTESYADIGGLEQQIQEIKESVELPLTHPELYEEMGIKPPKGVILYGVPGTGKTLLAKAVANQTSATFLRVVGSELIQKYLGDGPKLVRELFRVAEEHAPSIVFIDEIDAIGTKRYESNSGGEREIQRTMLELLNQLDGFDSRGDVKVVMATNRIESLDPALIRPGRIDRKIEFPLPDVKTKRRIFNIHTGRMTLSDDVDLEEFVMSKDDLSGADIKAICTEAGLLALRERRMKVVAEDLRKAKEKVLYRKTLLAKAVANQTSATFLRVVGSELIQKYLGDGPKLVRELFRVAEEHAPSIVFIDEIDAIGTKRYESNSGGEREIQRTMLELLNQLDGFDSRGDVKVVMATNRIESLDPALIRPGRIDRKIEFPLPDVKTKRRIFNIHTGRMTLSDDVDLEEFVMSKDDLSGADIKVIN